MTRSRRRTAALTAMSTIALLGVSAIAAAPSQAADRDRRPVTDRFTAAPVPWGACDPDDFYTLTEDGSSLVPPDYQCADYQVPLDYDQPRGEQITLALIRNPADDPAAKQGSIFVNPGGPGGSGVEIVAYAGGDLFGAEVNAAFDIVGFDPRGIAGSTGLQCYPDNTAFIADVTTNELEVPWPVTSAEYRAARRDARDLARDCERTAGPIIDHMGTTSVARDLEVLRRAVGDRQLNFIGYSYGTYICAQYMNLFPNRVGAMVCDANIDPVEYAIGDPEDQPLGLSSFARSRTERGTNASIEEFFRLCDEGGPEACAFAPNARARFYSLYGQLAASPLDLDGFSFDERSLVASANGPLYNSLFGYPYLAEFLAEIEFLVGGGVPEPVEPVDQGEFPIAEPVNEPYYGYEGFYGVSCSDNIQPDDFASYRRGVENSEGLFGPFWSSGDFPCAVWPGTDTDTYFGPFNKHTRNPVLIVNTLFDPATPYEDAVDHQSRLPNSALLTIEGWGHVGQGLSECGDTIIDQYMLTRTIPTGSTSCAQDIIPFSPEAVELFNPVDPDTDEPPVTEPAPEPEVPVADPEVAAEAVTDSEILDAAVDAALIELADSGDPAEATAEAAEVVIDALDEAGQTELADELRTREAILEQVRSRPLS